MVPHADIGSPVELLVRKTYWLSNALMTNYTCYRCETSLDTGYLDVSENRAPGVPPIPAKNFHYQQQQLHNQQQHHHQQPRSSSLKQIHDTRAYNNNNNNNTYHHPVEMRAMSPSMSNKMKPISVNVSYGAATPMPNSEQMLRNIPSADSQIHLNAPPIVQPSEKHTKPTYLSPIPTNSSKTHSSTEIQMESPVNMTVVEQGKIIMPYKEVTKPFEMSDFYKYSTKYRQKQGTNNNTMPPLARINANNQSIEDNNNSYQ
jgi:hypothetical protein